jgi:hypothetical protein
VGSFGGNGKKKHITTDLRKTNDLTEQSALESKVKADDETLAYLSKVQALQTPPPTSGVYINEVMASNSETASDLIGGNSDWIEILNNTSNSVDLNGYYFTDNSNEFNKFQITRSIIIPAFGREIIWASGEPQRGVNHLDFSLSSSGEFIALTQPDGATILDSLSFPKQRTDVSFGRETDGSNHLRFFSPASFNTQNDAADAYLGILEPPTFSHQGGFYQSAFNLTLTTADSGATIYYSTDGSKPSQNNIRGISYQYKNQFFTDNLLTSSYETKQYISNIPVVDRTSDPNKISRIASTVSSSGNLYYFPDYQLYKGTPVRAISHRANYLSSRVATYTYFIHPEISPKFDIPVVSISSTESNFFDFYEGIYVPGNTNTQQESEKLVNFEFIKNDDSIISQQMGVRLQGSGSRVFPMKSLRIFARAAYSSEEAISYKLFTNSNKTNFKRILLRNSGNDFSQEYLSIMFRDAFIQTSVKHLDIDCQAYEPVAMFLNGEFWGLHNLRENLDKYYLEEKYGMNADSVDIMEDLEVKQGDAANYNSMNAFFRSNNDLSSPSLFATASKLIDLRSYIDYQITEIFYHNNDWITNNVSQWREKVPSNNDHPKGRSGKWRWFLFDTDFGARYYGSNLLDHAIENQYILKRLLTNQTFKNDFINRYADLMNSAFTSSRLVNLIDSLEDNIKAIIPQHIDRWKNIADVSTWESNVNTMKIFTQNRIGFEKNHVRNQFNIPGNYNLPVNVSDQTAGYIHVNTIDILTSTPGVDSSPYPWTGEYFANIPLQIHARPNIGYKLKHWEYNGSTITDSVLTINTSSNVSYKAIFEEDLLSANPEPVAFNVDKCGYTFKFWDSEATEATFPANMAFVYMDQEDPTLTANIAGFTSGDYDNDSKTRINGLGENGVSFINTGSGREGYPETRVGGAILSIKTTNYNNLSLAFTAGTVTSNSREYNLRLQYRVGDKLPFTDLIDENDQPVEYLRSTIDGHEQQFEVNLPASLMEKPYIQLFWRYYYTGTKNSEVSGARDEIRLDEVKLRAKLLLDQPVSFSIIYDKYAEITAESTIESSIGLILEAGKVIIFKPGFSTGGQTVFSATVTGCPE